MSTFPAELTGTWEIDTAHSHVGFAARHAVVATTRGHFSSFSGGATIDAQAPENSTAWLEIDPASITTGNHMRDGHLKSADFFNVEAHPKITFKSTNAKVDGDSVILSGDLTIAGVTSTVDVVWEFGGVVTDPYGALKSGFEGTASLSRKEFGLNYNAALEAGGVLISDWIKLTLEIEAAKKI